MSRSVPASPKQAVFLPPAKQDVIAVSAFDVAIDEPLPAVIEIVALEQVDVTDHGSRIRDEVLCRATVVCKQRVGGKFTGNRAAVANLDGFADRIDSEPGDPGMTLYRAGIDQHRRRGGIAAAQHHAGSPDRRYDSVVDNLRAVGVAGDAGTEIQCLDMTAGLDMDRLPVIDGGGVAEMDGKETDARANHRPVDDRLVPRARPPYGIAVGRRDHRARCDEHIIGDAQLDGGSGGGRRRRRLPCHEEVPDSAELTPDARRASGVPTIA
ncbi:MAG: hypothetical protein KL863_06770 [Rhizobium sp.]|nr:hypothetical protein [Rhizobium sp.]